MFDDDRAAGRVEDRLSLFGVEPGAFGARDPQRRRARPRHERRAGARARRPSGQPDELRALVPESARERRCRARPRRAPSRLPLTKYLPVTPSSSGALASWTEVRAPFAGLVPTSRMPTRIQSAASRAISVATPPGWSEFEVTPRPGRAARELVREQDVGELRLPVGAHRVVLRRRAEAREVDRAARVHHRADRDHPRGRARREPVEQELA